MVAVDGRLAFDLDEDERDEGNGTHRADWLWPDVRVLSETVSWTRLLMVFMALSECADKERGGGLYPSGNVC